MVSIFVAEFNIGFSNIYVICFIVLRTWQFLDYCVLFQFKNKQLGIKTTFYMALSHKDWELPNPRIWLAETDIDRGLDFPI